MTTTMPVASTMGVSLASTLTCPHYDMVPKDLQDNLRFRSDLLQLDRKSVV